VVGFNQALGVRQYFILVLDQMVRDHCSLFLCHGVAAARMMVADSEHLGGLDGCAEVQVGGGGQVVVVVQPESSNSATLI
jgi:hypothetical protein